MKKTVLIVGISSFLGSNLAQVLRDQFRVVGTYFKTPVELPGITCYPCDIFKKDYISSLIGLIKPDFTIYAVGMSSLMECKLFPKQADALNAAGAINCCVASERHGSKFIYISSCYVMAGDDVFYRESDTPFPNTIYGSTVSSAEYYVQRSCLNYLILRSGPLYGRSYGPRHPHWFEFLQSALSQNAGFQTDDSVTTGFMDVVIFGRILKQILLSQVTNRLFQVTSSDTSNRYDFAKIVAKIFRKDENLIQKGYIAFPSDSAGANSKMGAKTQSSQYFFKMDLTNIESFLGMKMPTIDDSLGLTYKRLVDNSI